MGWTWGLALLATGGWVAWWCSRRGERPLLAEACTAFVFAGAFWFFLMFGVLFAGLALHLREVKAYTEVCTAFAFYCCLAVVPLGIASRIVGTPPKSDGVGLSGSEE